MTVTGLPHVLAIVLNSFFLLGLVIGVTYLLRRTSASVRYQVLLGAFLGLLVLPD